MHYSQAEVFTALQLFEAFRANEMPTATMTAIIKNDAVTREVIALANNVVAERHLLAFDDVSIRSLQLPTRVTNLMLRHSVTSIGVLALQTEQEVLLWRGGGPYTVRYAQDLLQPYGLTLRPADQTITERLKQYASHSSWVQTFKELKNITTS